ncbi:MAG: FprA family A-type flavoprotein [Candidatus Aureabacteria bacterium]|nr:FprA family A-type flavoprotein [Candidatus Auribacterota bacterium]
MKAIEIKKNIYWVGGIDWDLRDFHGYLTQKGSTYNSYLIVDEKIVLVDTVKHYLVDEMLERITNIIDPSKIDYIVSNHVEMDHSGGLPKLLKICPNATIITSPNGKKGLKSHFKEDWNFKVVNTGDSINIGKNDLQFVLMPMVHWPDSMATYINNAKLLLPNDAFGQHVASTTRFDDEIGWSIASAEAAKYYANIVLSYGSQVKKALDAVSGLEIDMIGPSHGIIWRSHINDIIELYKKWADNIVEEKAVIAYDTMWDSTDMLAKAILNVFEDKGITAQLMSLKTNHISDVMTQLLTAKYICVGSPTLNNNMLPSVAAFLTYMKGLAPKKRVGLAFGSYGWGGQSIGEIDGILKNCGFEMLEPIKAQYIPDDETLKQIKEKLTGGLK